MSVLALLSIFVIIAFVFVVGLFMLVALAGIGYVVLRRFQAPPVGDSASPPPANEAERARQYLAAATLRAWDSSAFSDLSSRWVGWWKSVSGMGQGTGYYEGVVQSFSAPADPAWLAFTVRRWRMRDAEVQLRTSQQQVTLHITAEGPMNPNGRAEVQLGGQPAGQIEIRFPVCHFHSADGTVQGVLTKRAASLRDNYYAPIELNGRGIAGLTEIWIRQPKALRQPHLAFQNLAPDLSPTEQDWLLVMLALTLYYDSLWARKYD